MTKRIGEGGGAGRVGVGHDRDEAVAAGAPEGIGLSNAEPEAEGDLAQDGVGAGVAVEPIELSEAVDVDQRDGQGMAVAASLSDLDAEALHDRAAARDAGERVDRRRALQLGRAAGRSSAWRGAAPRSWRAARWPAARPPAARPGRGRRRSRRCRTGASRSRGRRRRPARRASSRRPRDRSARRRAGPPRERRSILYPGRAGSAAARFHSRSARPPSKRSTASLRRARELRQAVLVVVRDRLGQLEPAEDTHDRGRHERRQRDGGLERAASIGEEPDRCRGDQERRAPPRRAGRHRCDDGQDGRDRQRRRFERLEPGTGRWDQGGHRAATRRGRGWRPRRAAPP